MDRFPGLGHFAEYGDFPSQLRVVCLVYPERLGGVRAFTAINDVVRPVKKQVDLGTIRMRLVCDVASCAAFREDTVNAERLESWGNMFYNK
ncbi:MAG: hypothetical protein J6334_06510 [Kiritimatiellae bacterium]|nr:hypothetical protein [Kiritimatiellia bacterium]